jgi:hypothetical protein
MVTTWTLVLILAFNGHYSSPIVINGLPSYAECSRIEKVLTTPEWTKNFEYKSSCIEVNTK